MSEQLGRAERGVLGWIDRDITGPMADFQDPSQEWRRLFSEFYGTFLLVLVAAGGGMMGQAFPNMITRSAAVVAPGLIAGYPLRDDSCPAPFRPSTRLAASGVAGCPRPRGPSGGRPTSRWMAVRTVPPSWRPLAPWTPWTVTGLDGLPNCPQHHEQEPEERNREQDHLGSVARGNAWWESARQAHHGPPAGLRLVRSSRSCGHPPRSARNRAGTRS